MKSLLQQIFRGLITFILFALALFIGILFLFLIFYTIATGPNWGRALIGIAFICWVGIEYGKDSSESGWWPW